MTGIKDYSTVASNNTSLFPEGMSPSSVNDSARQVQADIRTWYNTAEWQDLGNIPTYVSTTSFSVTGDQTAFYLVGRRIRISDSSTLYGTISVSAYTSLTTVTVVLDSGSISASITAVAVGVISVPAGGTGSSIKGSAIGDVTSTSNITDNAVVRGDGGAKGVQTSLMTISDTGVGSGLIAANIGDAGFTLTTSGGIVLSSNAPRFHWHESDGGSDAKLWREECNGGNLTRTTLTDAGGTPVIFHQTTRSGNSVTGQSWTNGSGYFNFNSGTGIRVDTATAAASPAAGDVNAKRLLVNGVQQNAIGTNTATTSGTSVDFASSLPAGIKKITVVLNDVSTSGTSHKLLQLGDSGGIENTAYISTSGRLDGSTDITSSTAGFVIYTQGATDTAAVVITLFNVTGNTWIASHAGSLAAARGIFGGGSKSLSATLDRLRLTTVGGADTFDAGSINIFYD